MNRYHEICCLLQNATEAVMEFAHSGDDLGEKAINYDADRLLEIESVRSDQLERVQGVLQALAVGCEEQGGGAISDCISTMGLSEDKQACVYHICTQLKTTLMQLQQRNMNDMLQILAARQVAHSLLMEAGMLKAPATYGPVR